MSCRKTTLCKENDTVGPWGRCDTVMAVGVPRCSCKRTISERPLLLQDRTSSGRIVLPRFNRMAVGINNRISLEKAARRLEGERDVVTRTRGSTIPESAASVKKKKINSQSSNWFAGIGENRALGLCQDDTYTHRRGPVDP